MRGLIGSPRAGRIPVLPALIPILLTVLSVAALTGCAQPSHRFVSSTEDDMVVKVPSGWTVVRSGALQTSASQSPSPGSWFANLDAANPPGAKRFLQSGVTAPMAVARTLVLSDSAASSMSDDDLRDFVLPVTASARTTALASGNTFIKTFVKLTDLPAHSGTAHGVHVTYSYDRGSGIDVFDQLALVDVGRARLYFFAVQCSQSCWNTQQRSIDETVRSFAVKTP